MYGDDNGLIIARHDYITGVIRPVRVSEEEILWVGLLIWVFTNHFSSKDDPFNVLQASSAQVHPLGGVFREAEIIFAYPP